MSSTLTEDEYFALSEWCQMARFTTFPRSVGWLHERCSRDAWGFNPCTCYCHKKVEEKEAA